MSAVSAVSGDLDLPPVVRAVEPESTVRAVFEVLGTARAVRYLSTAPVPDAELEALVWAATRASSADNTQPWAFVVVTDPQQRRRIAAAVGCFDRISKELPEPTDPVARRTRGGAAHLLESLADVPALLFVCGRNDYPPTQPQERYLWSAVFAASQNIVVAARALGLSAVLTMLHVANPAAVREILGVPREYKIAAMFAVGRPERATGAVTRRPLAEVIHRDRW